MAKFLTTVGNSFYIEQLILKADQSITLVTPYLYLSVNVIQRLSDASERGVLITLIYGKSELTQAEQSKLNALRNIEMYFCDNLHAKCYSNDQQMIITSMNLYEFSERNNREMGILIDRTQDIEIYIEALQEINSIKNSSILKKSSSKPIASEPSYQLDPSYCEQHNFHVPELYKLLISQYPFHNIALSDSKITVANFPHSGITMEVNGIVTFYFENQLIYEKYKYKIKDEMYNLLPKERIYWNYLKVAIYGQKGLSYPLNADGIDERLKNSTQIITAFENKLTDTL